MKRIQTLLADQRGITGMTFGISLATLLGMAAMTIDLGRAYVARGELQNIADSAALAAAGRLGIVYQDIATSNGNLATSDVTISGSQEAEITTVANSMANLHSAGGQANISLAANDMKVGTFNTANENVVAGLVSPDATTIRVRRDANQNGPIATIFAAIFGSQSMGLTATATAALGPATSVPPAGMTAPFGISEQWFKNGGQCNDAIRFSPANDPLACAGWHVYDEIQQSANPTDPTHCQGGGHGGGGNNQGGANAQLLRAVLDCLKTDDYSSPETIPHQTSYDFTNGEAANAFNNLQDLYDSKKDANGEWEISIPIYQSTDCLGPIGKTMIVGFARATVFGIDVQNRIIDAKVDCNAILPDAQSGPPGTGLGGGLSPKGTIPGLVL